MKLRIKDRRALIQAVTLIVMTCIALAFPRWGEYTWSLMLVMAIIFSWR